LDDLLAGIANATTGNLEEAIPYLETVVSSEVELPDELITKYLSAGGIAVSVTERVKVGVAWSSLAATLTLVECYQVLGRTEEASQLYSYNAVRERAERVWRKAELEHSDFQLHEGRHSFKAFLEATEIRDSRIDRYMGHANHSVQARYSYQLDSPNLDDAKALSAFLRLADTPARMEMVRTSCAPVSTS
jgi:hypothetical protein